jgi:hypothetical protein
VPCHIKCDQSVNRAFSPLVAQVCRNRIENFTDKCPLILQEAGTYPEAAHFPPWEIDEAQTVKLLPMQSKEVKAEAQVQALANVHGSIGECNDRCGK